MVGSAVSSRRPTDFQPSSPCSATKRQAEAGVHQGWPYSAVGMQRAVDSSIGLPSRSTSASRMLVFVTPPDVRRSFNVPPEFVDVARTFWALADPYAVETGEPARTHRFRPTRRSTIVMPSHSQPLRRRP